MKLTIDNWTEHAIAMSCIEQLMGLNLRATSETGIAFLALAIAVEDFEKANLDFNGK